MLPYRVVLTALSVGCVISQSVRGGLVAHWNLEEGSGTSTTATVGAPSANGTLGSQATWVTGSLANVPSGTTAAVNFDSAGTNNNGIITTSYAGVLGSSARTVTAWIKADTVQGENAFILSYGTNSNGQRFSFRINTSSGDGVVGALRLEIQGSKTVASTSLLDGQWHHVAVTLPSGASLSNAVFYVDGQVDNNQGPDTTGLNTVSGNLVSIGGSTFRDGDNFDGIVDDIRMYDHQLSQSEITALHEGNIPRAINVAPSIGATGVSTTPTFEWTAENTTNPTYAIRIGTLAGTDNVLSAQSTGNNTTFTPTPGLLDSGTTYYWSITVTDGGQDYLGDPWSFTTAGVSPNADSDGDLLRDADEVGIYGTNPAVADSDGDGVPDGLEVNRGDNPNDPNSRMERPNILFIMTDDLGYGDLGVLFQNSIPGTKKHFTPQLDQMAAEGMILDQHYCPAPVCAPSRASFILGVHQGHSDIRNNQFDKALPDNHNIATAMKAAGYKTALVGKYGLQGGGSSAATWPAYPTKRGFDEFYGYVRHADGHQHYPANSWPIGNSNAHRSPKELWHNDNEVSSGLDKCYTTDLFTARTKQMIIDQQNNDPQQPFFIFLAYDTPHAALQLPTQAYPAGGGVNGGLQWNGTPGNMINTASGTIDTWRHPDYTGKGWTNAEERFATSVRRIDDCIGDLIQTLKDLNIDDETLVIFTNDNGPHNVTYISGVGYAPTSFDSYGPFDGIKRDTREGGVRMPTLVRWPGTVPAGQVNNDPSQFHDWLPTFSELGGWTAPSLTDGVSLVPTITDVGRQQQGLVYIEYFQGGSTPSYSDFLPAHRGQRRDEMQVIHLDGYKGIRLDIASHADNFEIYNINTDLREGINLAGTSAFFNDLQQRMKDTVLRVRQPNSTASRPYDNELVPAMIDFVEEGVDYCAYEGVFPWVPEFTVMSPVATAEDTTINVNHLTRQDDAGLLISGYIDVPADGVWTFYLQSDSGAHLRIHKSQVIDDDFNHTGQEVQGTIRLQAGLHPFRLYYRTDSRTPSLSLQWAGTGVSKQAIPASALFRAVKGDLNEDNQVQMLDVQTLENDWLDTYDIENLKDIGQDWLKFQPD